MEKQTSNCASLSADIKSAMSRGDGYVLHKNPDLDRFEIYAWKGHIVSVDQVLKKVRKREEREQMRMAYENNGACCFLVDCGKKETIPILLSMIKFFKKISRAEAKIIAES